MSGKQKRSLLGPMMFTVYIITRTDEANTEIYRFAVDANFLSDDF